MKLVVIGGNGFLGHSVCRSALSKGWQVTSISSSGQSFKTKSGHTPAWTDRVEWLKADIFIAGPHVPVLKEADAVVSTVGTLFEADYKSPSGIVNAVLRRPDSKYIGHYEKLNRDAAVAVAKIFAQTPPKPFVYVSAEDIAQPIVPARYIETKREAETLLGEMDLKLIVARPSLMYHAHLRPLSALPATLTSVTSTLFLPLPTKMFSGPAASVYNLLKTPSIHVDTVAQAICTAIEKGMTGVLSTRAMKDLVQVSAPSGQ